MKSHPYKKKYIVTQTFLNPNQRYSSGYHLGIDLVGLEDKTIYAVQSGTVNSAVYDSSFGNNVIVRQNDGLYTRYSHLESMKVTVGQDVISGQTVIGIEGKTGSVVGSGDPRHLELRISRTPYYTDDLRDYIDPSAYLGFPNELNYVVIPGEEKMTKMANVILYKSEIDKRAADYLADYLGCKAIEFDLLPPAVLDEVFEKIYVIGTPDKPVAKAINIYGQDRYETCQKVLDMIKEARRIKAN
ncbi:MAG TPA: M23 family metallopeptidase [Peptococcaceae bacterium]|nr:M23 family metallopeptidase [Peptococcaceae bacterium]